MTTFPNEHPSGINMNTNDVNRVLTLLEVNVDTWAARFMPPETTMPYPIEFHGTIYNGEFEGEFMGRIQVVNVGISLRKDHQPMWNIETCLDATLVSLCNKWLHMELDANNRMHVHRAKGTISVRSTNIAPLELQIKEEMVRHIALTLKQSPF